MLSTFNWSSAYPKLFKNSKILRKKSCESNTAAAFLQWPFYTRAASVKSIESFIYNVAEYQNIIIKDVGRENNPDTNIETFIETMKINKMYELPNNSNFKWAMIEHNEFGYCWTIGYKGICTTAFSTDGGNDIKYWTSEADARKDLISKILINN